jgi:hypothetical protein
MRFSFLALLLMGLLGTAGAWAQVVYVDIDNTGAQDGTSWATAYTTLQAGIDDAFGQGGGQVWVAEGSYGEARTETWGAPASITGSLVLKDGVEVYGGFRGVETALGERAPSMAVTVIDGSTARGGIAAFHVVVAGGLAVSPAPIVLDGFTVTGGNAVGVPGDYHTWRGGGLYNWSKTNLAVSNCTFVGNSAEVSGGAIANEGAGPAVSAAAVYSNCLIVQNDARRGADDPDPLVANAIRGGGGIFVNRSEPSFAHVTVADNTLQNNAGFFGVNSGGIYATAEVFSGDGTMTTTMAGAIFWNNTGAASVTTFGGALGISDSNMQAVNPVFRAAATVNEPFDYMLTIGVSPDIDSTVAHTATDISLVPRPVGANGDKGAFEMSANGPVAGCIPTTVDLDASGDGSIVLGDVESGSTAEAGIWYTEVDQTDFDCSDLGTPAVTVTAYDRIGRSATCNPVVTVEDNIEPVAVGQNATVQLDATGNATLLGSAFDGGSTDNCGSGGLIFTTVPATVDCTDVGPVPVVLTVMDISGNMDTVNVTATVEDNVDPTALCQSITVQLDGTGNASIVPADVDNGSNDACGIASLTLDIDTFTCGDIGPNTVTLTVEDNNGNTDQCTATVTVEDNVTPTAVCQDITVQLDATGNASIVPAQIDNGSSDVCGPVALSLDIDAFDCSDVGTPVTVTLTAEDGSGNTDDCTATVTVEDNVAPDAICQDNFVYLDGLGNASIVPADIDNGSNDACSVPTLSVSPDTFTSANLGPNTITLSAEDASGNIGECTATLTVVDDLSFALDLPAGITGNAGTPNYSGISVSVAGGITPYSFVWTYDDGVSPVILVDGPHPADASVTVSGTDSDTLLFDELKTTLVGDYFVEVTDSGDPRMITSATGTLTVTTILEVFLPASVRAYTDFAGPLVLDALVVNSTPPLTVTWYKDGQPLAVQPGITTLDLGVPELSEAGDYEVQVVDSDLPPQDVTSNVSVVAIADPLSIAVQPADQNQYESETAAFMVTAQDGFPPYTYDWREFAASLGEPSQDSFELAAVTLADDGRTFDVVVTDEGANQTNFAGPLVPTTVTSLPATLGVSTALSIDEQPVGVDAYTDDPPFTLSALYSGGMLPISVVWQREDTDTMIIDQVAGPQAPDTANTVALTIDPSVEAPGSYLYTAELTDQVRTTSTDETPVTISVPPAVSDDLVDAVGVDGKEFTWSIGITGGFGNLDIDWKKDDGSKALVSLVDDGRIDGQGTTSLTFDPVTFADAGTYQVDISDDGGRMATAGPAQLTIAAGVPAAGLLGLSGLALLSALGGAAAIRRRRK